MNKYFLHQGHSYPKLLYATDQYFYRILERVDDIFFDLNFVTSIVLTYPFSFILSLRLASLLEFYLPSPNKSTLLGTP